MPIVTTYVCDISGYSSNHKSDFVEITISGRYRETPQTGYDIQAVTITKFVHKPVANKLGFMTPNRSMDEATKKEAEQAQASVSFEGQLKLLLKPWVEEIAQEVVDSNA